MIERPRYLQKLISWKDKQAVKIITGVRRAGKSTLFKIYQEYLAANGVSGDQIIAFNMEDPAHAGLLNWESLYADINKRLAPDKKNYVFLDEIQNVPDFQRAADGLFIKDNVDLYLTGSNSRFQSGEWATMLAGRYVEIHILPLSFREYVSAYPYHDTHETMYRNYLENSSFPYAMILAAGGSSAGWDKTLVQEYLSGIYSSIVLKDVAEARRIKDLGRLERTIRFMADTIGSPVSANNIANTMTSRGTKIDYHTVESYLEALCGSYILYRAGRYDVKGKKILKTLNKYYLVDPGLRFFMLGDRRVDSGHLLENVVYLELLRRNRNVFTGRIDSGGKKDGGAREIDFVTEGINGTGYYQVAETVLDPKTLDRELAPLNAVPDHNAKYLLTLDRLPPQSYNGIKHVNALDWLLGSDPL